MGFYQAKNYFINGDTNNGLIELAKSLQEMEDKVENIERQIRYIHNGQ
ncbi:MAG: hypothetical protein V1667_03745 [bacterium]